MEKSPLVAMRHIHKRFGGVHAVNDVSSAASMRSTT